MGKFAVGLCLVVLVVTGCGGGSGSSPIPAELEVSPVAAVAAEVAQRVIAKEEQDGMILTVNCGAEVNQISTETGPVFICEGTTALDPSPGFATDQAVSYLVYYDSQNPKDFVSFGMGDPSVGTVSCKKDLKGCRSLFESLLGKKIPNAAS